MPEGDTIWRLSERLQPLVGRVITHSDFRIAPLATASLTGERIDRIWPYGKHLYWQCGERILHTHLLMDGEWRIHSMGRRWSKPAHTARLVVHVDGVELVGHDLGVVELWPAQQYGQRTAHLCAGHFNYVGVTHGDHAGAVLPLQKFFLRCKLRVLALFCAAECTDAGQIHDHFRLMPRVQ